MWCLGPGIRTFIASRQMTGTARLFYAVPGSSELSIVDEWSVRSMIVNAKRRKLTGWDYCS